MNKLHSGQIEGTHQNLSAFLAEYEIQDFTDTPIKEGIENSSFRINAANTNYVLRVYRQNNKSEGAILRELSFMDFLREAGIPVPLVVSAKGGTQLTTVAIDETRWNAILMEFVEGESKTPHPSQLLIGELAQYHAKIHLLGIEFSEKLAGEKHMWTELREGYAEKIQDPEMFGDESKLLIDRIKNYVYPLSTDLPYGYNHLDLDFGGNVLTNGDHVAAIIDFEDSQYSPIVVCLGFTLWGILDDAGEDAMRYYLREYEKVRTLSAREYETLPHVVFFRNYVVAAVRLTLGSEEISREDIVSNIKLEHSIPHLKFRE